MKTELRPLPGDSPLRNADISSHSAKTQEKNESRGLTGVVSAVPAVPGEVPGHARQQTTVDHRRPVLVIGSRRRRGLELRDLWLHRELFYMLAWRDVKVRYKQSALGVTWVILQPLLTMVIFTLLFGK